MIRVHRIPFSTNVERVALAAGHKGLGVEWVDHDPADRSGIRGLSGQELVPVAEIDGEVIFDSMRIVESLERLHPDPPLYPREPAARAEVELFVEWFNEVWKGPPNAIEQESDLGRIAELSARMDAWLDLFERLLAGREHLLAHEFSAADCVAFPFLKFAGGRDPDDDELFHRILDEYQSVEGRPRLAAWIKRVDARPRAY